MKKNEIIIYTNEQCPYCKQVKEKLEENDIKFTERLITEKDFSKEWNDISFLTGIPTVPTIEFKNEYFVAGRDFMHPDHLVAIIKEFNKTKYSSTRLILERLKTLNFNMSQAFQRVDGILRNVESKIPSNQPENTEENEHKSTS